MVAPTDLPLQLRREGGSIRYRVQGSPRDAAQPLLVLVHGWCCDAGYWDAQLADLAVDHRVVTLDLAGHGRSADASTDGCMSSFGADVAAVVEAVCGASVDGASVVLIGHSMGGPVSVEAALRLPDRVRAVIGVDTFASVGLPRAPAAVTAARFQPFERDFAASTRAYVEQAFFLPDADPALRTRIAVRMAAGDPTVGLAALRGINGWDGAAALGALTAPVVALNAAVTRTDGARLRGIVPGFRLREVEGVGHFLMMEQPVRFNALLREELAALAAG